jgi:hypothetical protein
MSAMINQLNGDEQNALVNAAKEGRLEPDKLNSRTAKIIAGLELKAPGTDWNAISAQTKYEKSATATNTKTLLNSVTPILDKVYQAGIDLQNSPMPGVNKVTNFVKEQVGNDKIVAFNNLRDDAIAEVERGLLGSGVLSDTKYIRAVKNLNSAQTPEQLKAAIDNTKFIIKTRLSAVKAGPNPESIIGPKSMGEENNPQATAPSSVETKLIAAARGGNAKAIQYLKSKGIKY